MRLIKPLPDPFMMQSGRRVVSPGDWQQRREEIKHMMRSLQYGTMPGPPEAVSVEALEIETLEPDKYSWGSISTWAWGGLRVLEYALSLPEVNRDQILISGHSRNGKTALLAGALDERIAIVNPAGSGCAGAGSYLALGDNCEDLSPLTSRERWWAWTHADFETRAGRETDLPFDQHFLMGLVAPRPLLRTEGTTDTWANPEGTCVSFLATEPIYDFCNVSERNGIYFHEGGHRHTEEDAAALLAFADWHFFGISPTLDFKTLIIDPSSTPPFFTWRCPD